MDWYWILLLLFGSILVLMFMAGMEIDFDAIRAAGRRSLGVPVLLTVGVFACDYAYHLYCVEQ